MVQKEAPLTKHTSGAAEETRTKSGLVERLRERRSRFGESPEQMLNFMRGILPLLKEAEEALDSVATAHDLIGGEEIERLRSTQANAVMPLIAPLMDAWEFMSNDVKGYMSAHCSDLCRCLTNIDHAMTGDEE